MSKERAAQLIDAGLWLKLSGDLDGAQKLFERALKLDPENQRVKTLLDGTADPQTVVHVVPTSHPSGITNPFERHDALTAPGTVPVEADWGMATGFESPAPFSSPSKVHAPQKVTEAMWSSTTVTEEPPSIAPVSMTAPPSGLTVVIGGGQDIEPPKPITTPPIFVKSLTPLPMPRATPPQFEKTPRSVVISGMPPPQASPPLTPPLYSGSPIVEPPNTIRLSGEPAAASPPRPSPNFTGPAPVAIASPPSPSVESNRASDSAWNWSGPHSSTANSIPAPSPIQGVAAPWPKSAPHAPAPGFAPQTAWDAKSNPGINLTNVVGEGRALELVGVDSPVVSSPSNPGTRVAAEVRSLLRGARDLLDLDDHSGAVELILKAQALAPDDGEVQALRERSERTLLAMFESKLGNMNAVPRVLLKDDEIIWLNLDHRAGFVLAQIDGTVSFDDVFAVSGMSRLDTARIIAQLIDEGVISRG